MSKGLRLLLFDRTCQGNPVGLSDAWKAGAGVYRTLDRLDASFGADNWEDALSWAASHAPSRPIREIQFWGHGRWGGAKIDDEHLDASSLDEGHRHRRHLDAIAERMNADSLWWFRTCETFGAEAGHAFAQRWTEHFGCPAAGHTFVIGFWQSGLHRLEPGRAPTWSTAEGLLRGTPASPEKAAWSRPWRPNTISCLRGSIPRRYV